MKAIVRGPDAKSRTAFQAAGGTKRSPLRILSVAFGALTSELDPSIAIAARVYIALSTSSCSVANGLGGLSRSSLNTRAASAVSTWRNISASRENWGATHASYYYFEARKRTRA